MGIKVLGKQKEGYDQVLNKGALEFIQQLHEQFNDRRLHLLNKRRERQILIDQGQRPAFLKETEKIRTDLNWKVAPTPKDLQKRWVEITGPTDQKMLINAMNSGADIFMADFEDANAPTWDNMVQGQINLTKAIAGTLSFESPEGKRYAIKDNAAVLVVRPRGWHLNEKHVLVNNTEVSGSLFDFGFYFFHNAKKLLENGSGPYFYLPKLESHLEARLWNDVFVFAQKELEIPQGSIRATVLIETILAAFEMEEILFELKEHSAGLNAGRWDYMFSIIKKFREDSSLHLPDRGQITMTAPFMRAYTELLVKTCHKRGAHAIGGMAAFIPNRKDPEITKKALEKVREDKLREVGDGCDGTWVAHPDLVSVAREIFENKLGTKPHQKERLRDEVRVAPEQLLSFKVPNGTITESGLRHNLNVALQYLASWLSGRGAAAIYNLMEDVATAEISRAQIWQWIHNHEKLDNGTEITKSLVEKWLDEEYNQIKGASLLEEARGVLVELIFREEFPEFLTLLAYKKLA